jgi:hypothetical protein
LSITFLGVKGIIYLTINKDIKRLFSIVSSLPLSIVLNIYLCTGRSGVNNMEPGKWRASIVKFYNTDAVHLDQKVFTTKNKDEKFFKSISYQMPHGPSSASMARFLGLNQAW